MDHGAAFDTMTWTTVLLLTQLMTWTKVLLLTQWPGPRCCFWHNDMDHGAAVWHNDMDHGAAFPLTQWHGSRCCFWKTGRISDNMCALTMWCVILLVVLERNCSNLIFLYNSFENISKSRLDISDISFYSFSATNYLISKLKSAYCNLQCIFVCITEDLKINK